MLNKYTHRYTFTHIEQLLKRKVGLSRIDRLAIMCRGKRNLGELRIPLRRKLQFGSVLVSST